GLSFVVRHPLLRRIVACTGISNLFSAITTTLLVLYALRTLGLDQGTLGLVLSAGAVGGVAGAVTGAPFARWVGEGRAIPLSVLLGDALGSWMVLVPTLWIAAGGQLLAALPVALSPLIGMRELPDELDETTPAAAPVGTPAAG